MQINYYKTYLQTIKNSLGTTMFQEFYIDEKDILNQGAVGCAYYVSNILKQFNLTPVGRANVDRVISDLEKKGWTHLLIATPTKEIPVGSILVRESHYGETYGKMHKHIGFYMGDNQAISNNSIAFTAKPELGYVPVQHHYTYNGQRPITAILTRDRNNPFADWLYHYELPIPCIQGNDENILHEHGLFTDEIDYWLGKNDGLENGRLCGPTCVLMALSYFGISTTLQEYIAFADTEITYTNAKTGEEKTVTCFTKKTGRYHSGLLYIAQELGKKWGQHIVGQLGDFTANTCLLLAQNILKKNSSGEKSILITSVTANFDTNKQTKGGHLVVIAGLDYNGYETTIIVCDPLSNTKKQLPLEQFLASCSGKYIILEETN